ncbi:reverse transcriptase domain-containing protein [Tanacetum coccineum]
MGIVVSTIHGAIKFHTKKGIGIVFSTNEAGEGAKRARKIPATSEERFFSCVNTEEKIIVNDKYRDQMMTIGKQLPNHFKKELQSLLKSNAYIFAWTHADMTGIPRTIMVEGKPFNTEHKLNKYSHIKPIKQKKRGLGPDRNMAACKETEELTKAGILRKKKTKTKQPSMQEKESSATKRCRLVSKMQDQHTKEEMLKDIQETFERFRSINMKLNPKKCSFGVEEGPFLGHLITKHGIKANPSKVKAVIDLDQPRTLKDIQSLNGKLAALSRFLSKGRAAKWAIELGEHDIVFLRREEKETPSDFLIKIPSEDNETKEKPKEVPDSSSEWRLYTDGASNSDGSGAGLKLIDPEGKEYTYALRFEFETTNNEVEYEALLAVEHVRRNQNKKAYALSKLALMTFEQLTKEVLVEVLTKRSIEEKEVSKVDTQERKSWMDPIHEYLLRSCGFNAELRSLVVRITKQGFYWPSMYMEVAKAIQDCKKSKEESAIRKAGTSGAIAAGSTWPFSHWGIHIIRPLPVAPGGL